MLRVSFCVKEWNYKFSKVPCKNFNILWTGYFPRSYQFLLDSSLLFWILGALLRCKSLLWRMQMVRIAWKIRPSSLLPFLSSSPGGPDTEQSSSEHGFQSCTRDWVFLASNFLPAFWLIVWKCLVWGKHQDPHHCSDRSLLQKNFHCRWLTQPSGHQVSVMGAQPLQPGLKQQQQRACFQQLKRVPASSDHKETEVLINPTCLRYVDNSTLMTENKEEL